MDSDDSNGVPVYEAVTSHTCISHCASMNQGPPGARVTVTLEKKKGESVEKKPKSQKHRAQCKGHPQVTFTPTKKRGKVRKCKKMSIAYMSFFGRGSKDHDESKRQKLNARTVHETLPSHKREDKTRGLQGL